MKIRSLSPTSTRSIKCPYDDPENPAEFEIADMLPLSIRSELKDNYSAFERNGDSAKSTMQFRFAARNIEAVRHGLKGVKNLPSHDDKQVEVVFTVKMGRTVVSDATLELLAIPIMADGYDTLIDWLADEILSANCLTDEDRASFHLRSK